ncbi:hypothetical protein QG071_08660 [Kingella kingae]|uniref:Uncharacterized protein n=1 Tax=Kingella negevensis TaxID=1522312 RepID=A0A238TCV7_9NEIS|nr:MULTISPECIES: hypothetical protein [Neisseriaceae]MDK4526201.1 hypothetical protein [Kingella kingae]MDK4532238.1 hypothetical protein [Kingella kingae]MDK4556114.1 hypothetical protein [Kingella kingae]MDK4577148.1 hypothetical protein [Kingella kingae]MDK4583161.1 hypothetical protein [Kingella kingae]
MKKSFSFVGLAVLALSLTAPAMAERGNKICSGSKGGFSHCSGEKFVCNDGSISGSKKICSSSTAAGSGKFTKGKKASSHKSTRTAKRTY